MSSEPLSSTISVNTDTRRSLITPSNDSNPSTPAATGGTDYFQQAKSRPGITRHYTSLQEHADQMRTGGRSPEEACLTPRYENRRGGFSWGLRPAYDDQREGTGNPLPPEQPCIGTPPSLQELMGRKTNDDRASSTNRGFSLDNTITSRSSTTRISTASNSDTLSRSNTRRSSIAVFLARHIPDVKIFAPENTSEHKQEARNLGEGSTILTKKERKLSFALPPLSRSQETHKKTIKPTSVMGEPASEPLNEPPLLQLSAQCGLKDRRNVKMDLKIPLEISDLPTRRRLTVDDPSNITLSRPRNPLPPCIRNEELTRHQDSGSKTAAIMEKSCLDQDLAIEGNMSGSGLLPRDVLPSSSESPAFERPPIKVRDRCYISRPRFGGNRSARSGTSRSGTSESTLARTPDGLRTPDDPQALKEQQIRTKEDLQLLSQSAKAARRRRWGWAGQWTSTGSDSSAQTPDPISNRRFSVNVFKRSVRLSDQADKQKRQWSYCNRPWRRKNSIPSSDQPNMLADMPVPPAFVPPGLQRVSTPPIFDANGEVKGKLADFFFDIHGASRRKQAVKSPGRIWDSDALLMSLQTDIDVDDDEDEEGPEGRVSMVPPQIEFEPTYGDPRLMASPEGLFNAKGGNAGYRVSSPGTQDAWFRIQYGETPDEPTLTALTLKESDERRKFEWVVPEHLPNSPLCPLHVKYHGPSIGVCYWHGRSSTGSVKKEGNVSGNAKKEGNGSGNAKRGGERGTQGYVARPMATGQGQGSRGLYDSPRVESKKRRLVSLASP